MRYLPLTRQVELELSSPEKLIAASPGTYFYRVGNDLFYLVDGSTRTRIGVVKKSFAINYQNQAWYSTVSDNLIIFANPYELWKKTGSGYNTTGWTYVSDQSLNAANGA